MLDLALQDDVLRHLGYPHAGLYRNSPSGGTLADGAAGYRYWTAYAQVLWRMNNMLPIGEARLAGKVYGWIDILGKPSAGDVVTVTLTGGGLLSPVTLSVTAGQPQNPGNVAGGYIDPDNATSMTQVNLTVAIAQAAAANPTLVAANIQVVAPYGTGPYVQRVYPSPTVAFTSPSSPFTISASAPGDVGLQVGNSGVLQSPYLPVNGSSRTSRMYGYVPVLDYLEAAQAGTTDNLDTWKADVWTARPTEIRERAHLYHIWRCKLGEYLGIPLGENVYAIQASIADNIGQPLRVVA